jgi:uncharacterized protein (DUF169 family)
MDVNCRVDAVVIGTHEMVMVCIALFLCTEFEFLLKRSKRSKKILCMQKNVQAMSKEAVHNLQNPYPYAEYSAVLREFLQIPGSPVAIGFAHTAEDIPEGLEEIGEKIRNCEMVNRARGEGKSFFATRSKHLCSGGAWSLGLAKLTDSLKTGQFYFKLGKFESKSSCKRTIDNVPSLEAESVYATMYAPLENTPFDPVVVLIIAEPFHLLKLSQAYLFKHGGRITSNFSGIQSVCADATVQPYLSGKLNVSLGCDGSRKFSDIKSQWMVAGIPIETLPDIVTALPIVSNAPGSSSTKKK